MELVDLVDDVLDVGIVKAYRPRSPFLCFSLSDLVRETVGLEGSHDVFDLGDSGVRVHSLDRSS
jgi:hypothetical protein